MAILSDSSSRKPLPPLAKAGLITATAAVILCFYLFSLLAAAFLGALLLLELTLFVILLRFGLVGIIAGPIQAHWALFMMLLRSLWLPSKSAEYRIPLQRDDAPALFKLIESLAAKFGVQPPDEIQLEMSVNAWVHLKGYRTGAGRTKLGLGYDLLAGLTVSEVEAVIAHEMAHAKLIQRGFKHFANGALGRCGTISSHLVNVVEEGRSIRKQRLIASALLAPADLLTRQLARLVAAYSRQDEFEADRGAAEVCGPNCLRSSLNKLDPLNEAAMRLPWRERVAQLQSGQSYSDWFTRELAACLTSSGPREKNAEVFDKYSSHPSLEDRLAALPPDIEQQTNDAPALTLLAKPDVTAEKLVEEIQRVAAIEEEKDSKALAKWRRRTTVRRSLRPAEVLALLVIIFVGLTTIGALIAGEWLAALICGALVAGAIYVYRKTEYRDSRALPIPPYAQLVHGRERKFDFEKQPEMEKEFAEIAARELKKKRRIARLVDEAYAALENCDYLRAHVAAREIFKHNNRSVEGQLAYAIATAAFYQFDALTQCLQALNHQTGFSSASTSWGGAWALMMTGDWAASEAFLETATRKNPDNRTLVAALALARARRGKLNSAIAKAREACTPSAPDKETAHLLISLLIDAGLLREANARIFPLQKAAETDADLQLAMVRLKVLNRDFEEAERWTHMLTGSEAKLPPARLLSLAHVFQSARKFDRAAGFYNELLGRGHYPEAHLGLAQIAYERHDKPAARAHLITALNLKTTLPEHAVGPLAIFIPILNSLAVLEEPAMCRAWNATLPSTGRYHEALANQIFLVFAPAEEKARALLTEILRAMEPEFRAEDLVWQCAPSDQQPARPVKPGVYRVTALPSNRPRKA